jgi:hypothetical protein
MCATLGQPPYPSCPIPAPFYLAVNLPLFWVGAPAAAIMSRPHPILGLSVYGVIFVNALTHLGAFVRAVIIPAYSRRSSSSFPPRFGWPESALEGVGCRLEG